MWLAGCVSGGRLWEAGCVASHALSCINRVFERATPPVSRLWEMSTSDPRVVSSSQLGGLPSHRDRVSKCHSKATLSDSGGLKRERRWSGIYQRYRGSDPPLRSAVTGLVTAKGLVRSRVSGLRQECTRKRGREGAWEMLRRRQG